MFCSSFIEREDWFYTLNRAVAEHTRGSLAFNSCSGEVGTACRVTDDSFLIVCHCLVTFFSCLSAQTRMRLMSHLMAILVPQCDKLLHVCVSVRTGQRASSVVSGGESADACSCFASDDVHELHLGFQPHPSQAPLPWLRKSESHSSVSI